MNSDNREIIIRHTGPLTISSLDSCLSQALFRPAGNKSDEPGFSDDPFHLGWEYVSEEDSYRFKIENLRFATAEGIVTLAAVIECLRKRRHGKVTLEIGPGTEDWFDALHLEQLVEGKWNHSCSGAFSKPKNCYAFPIWCLIMNQSSDCVVLAKLIADHVSKLLRSLDRPIDDSISAATQLISQEALLNVFEHSFEKDRIAFCAVTVTPVPRKDELGKLTYASNQELRWFEKYQGKGFMLEVAVADYGRNVPRTLWKAFKDKHPNSFAKMSAVSIGSNIGKSERAKLHHEISLWSFDHSSTRKVREDFPDELSLLNWRGLHRALNTAARLDGCLIMRSGQSRSGYTFIENRSHPLEPYKVSPHDFPGTGIVFRIPLHRESHSVKGTTEHGDNEPRPANLPIDHITSSENIRSNGDSQLGEKPKWIGVAHPFKVYSDDIIALLHMMRSIPPNVIPIHLFAWYESSTTLNLLHAFENSPPGPPRIMALWRPGYALRWKFVGKIPECMRPIVGHLEEEGRASISKDESVMFYAREWSREFSPILQLEDGQLKLFSFSSEIAAEDAYKALQISFEVWAQRTKSSWLSDEPHKYVRLLTGPCVKRYVSSLRILYREEFVAQSVGWKFGSLLHRFRSKWPNISMVTGSEASYFVARMLLQEYRDSLEISILSGDGTTGESPCVVFTDALYKGESLRALLKKVTSCVGVICCLDLRGTDLHTEEINQIPFTSLLQFPFDPGEIAQDLIPENDTILEVDSVTHIPDESAALASYSIGTNSDRESFINTHNQLFRYGLQISGGRIHVVTLPAEKIVKDHRPRLLDWLIDSIDDCLSQLTIDHKQADFVIFYRNEAGVKEVVDELGIVLKARQLCKADVFRATIPVVHSGPKEIFGRPTSEFFHGLTQIPPTELFITRRPANYIAIYIDDACVTGKTLKSFLIRAVKADGQPLAILSLPVVSRINATDEVLFQQVCCGIFATRDLTKPVPFFFSPLFRLEANSFETMPAVPSYEMSSRFESLKSYLDVRLNNYVASMMRNFGIVAHRRADLTASLSICQHPFYGQRQEEAETVTTKMVRIRHLISLQAQNVAVLNKLLSELHKACKEHDFNLLTMLAIEPSLFDTPCLQKECRRDILQLAISAIMHEVSFRIKSDALCVLSLDSQTMLEALPKLLPEVVKSIDLVNQLLLSIRANLQRDSLRSAGIDLALEQCKRNVPQEEYDYISGCVKSFGELAEPIVVHDRSEAIRLLEDFIGQTAYHGEGLFAVNKVTDWLLEQQSERERTDSMLVTAMIADASSFLRKTVLPGFAAMIWWTEHIKMQIEASSALKDARSQLTFSLNVLDAIREQLHPGSMQKHIIEQVESNWNVIRQNAFRGPSDKFLSVPTSPPRQEVPALERWMPLFFSFPFEIASSLSLGSQTQPEVVASWEKDEQRLTLVMVPVPVDDVRQMFRLVINDMEKHGERIGGEILFSLVRNEAGGTALMVTFQNIVRRDDSFGTGKSQSRVAAIADRHKLQFAPDPPRSAGEPYRAQFVFPEIYDIEP